MDAGTWGIVAVLVIGTAVVAYGWLSDRAATRRELDNLARPPDRTIPRFHPDEARPRYLSELEAAVRPEDAPATDLDPDARHSLTERVHGAPSFPAGWTSRGFITDPATGWSVLDHPLVLVCVGEVTTIRELLPALRHAREAGRPLVVVTPDATAEVEATLRANQVQGKLSCVLVLLADADLRRSLCSLTGGRLVPAEDLRSGWLPPDHLGSCETWVSDEDDSWVLLQTPPRSQVGL